MKKTFFLLSFVLSVSLSAQQYTDKPYHQDYSDKFELDSSLENANLLQIRSDRNEAIKIISSTGLLQAWDKKVTNDIRYRPLADMQLIAMERYQGQFVFLTDKAVLSNAWAGKIYIDHGIKSPTQFAIGEAFTILIASQDELALFRDGKKLWSKTESDLTPIATLFDKKGKRFIVLTKNAAYELKGDSSKLSKLYSGKNLTAVAVHKGNIILGTTNGILTLSGASFSPSAINQKLPATEITSIESINDALWFGSTKGAFKLREDGKYDYYASKRWLVDDEVVDIAKGANKSVLILTKKKK